MVTGHAHAPFGHHAPHAIATKYATPHSTNAHAHRSVVLRPSASIRSISRSRSSKSPPLTSSSIGERSLQSRLRSSISTVCRGGLLPTVTTVSSCHCLLFVRCIVFAMWAGPAEKPHEKPSPGTESSVST
jgi:hypothetical protein